MSISQIKNLNRRLENLSKEASSELDKLCGNELWKSIGFEAFDGLDDAGLRASAIIIMDNFKLLESCKTFLVKYTFIG